MATITKASGEQELFNESKLRHSLSSSGADKQIIDHIVRSVNEMLYEGISPTKESLSSFCCTLQIERSPLELGSHKRRKVLKEAQDIYNINQNGK